VEEEAVEGPIAIESILLSLFFLYALRKQAIHRVPCKLRDEQPWMSDAPSMPGNVNHT
jgi:hypothetical protein